MDRLKDEDKLHKHQENDVLILGIQARSSAQLIKLDTADNRQTTYVARLCSALHTKH